jgi:hypothetical protein
MGLDIAFNKAAALTAGLQITYERNGTDEQIAAAIDAAEDDTYIGWLQRVAEMVHIPDTEFCTENCGVNDIVIRANKWGSIYAPMTAWLKAHNITWSEF